MNKVLSCRNKLFWVLIAFLFVLLSLRDFSLLNIPGFLFVVYLSIVFLVSDLEKFVSLLITLPVLSPGIPITYTLVCALFIFLFKFKVRFRAAIIVVFAMLAWELLHFMLYSFEIIDYLRFFVPYLLISLVFFSLKRENINLLFVVKTFLVVSSLCMLVAFVSSISQFDYSLISFLKSGIRFGNPEEIAEIEVTRYALSYNQNFVGLICLLNITICLQSLYYKYFNKPFSFVILVLSLIFGLLTMSRTFLICLLVALALFLITIIKRIDKLVLYLCVGMVLLVIFSVAFSSTIESFVSRFEGSNIASERVDIFNNYNSFILSDPYRFVFGLGFQNLLEKVNYYSPIRFTNVPHNAFQEVFVCWGIIGLVLVSVFLFEIYKKAKKARLAKINLISLIPMITFFIFLQASRLFRMNSRVFLLYLVYATLVVSAYPLQQVKERAFSR